jgi:hypothetical protein
MAPGGMSMPGCSGSNLASCRPPPQGVQMRGEARGQTEGVLAVFGRGVAKGHFLAK